MTSLAPPKVPIRHGGLIKRSVAKSMTTIKAKFQHRFFKLFEDELTYWTEDGKNLKGSIKLTQMRACERVDKDTFKRPYMFQVVYVSRSDKMRILYIQGPCFSTTKSWIEEIRRLLETAVGADKYTHYHKGAFLKNCWSCCKNKDKYAKGCTGISESDEARTTRLSRNISNVSAFSPRFARDGSEMDGSWETLGRSASPATFLSDDEYTDDEL
ncbi:hypothetical protein ACHWQZ_G006005 [Mnemiopsis leidyi]